MMNKSQNLACIRRTIFLFFFLSSFLSSFLHIASASGEERGIVGAAPSAAPCPPGGRGVRDLVHPQVLVFHTYLTRIKKELPFGSERPSIFIIYSWDNDQHKSRVRALYDELRLALSPPTVIYFDQETNRPSGSHTVFSHAEEAIQADKVIVVGSPTLKGVRPRKDGKVTQGL